MRDRYGPVYTVGFATAVAAVCSVAVASSVVLLGPRQEENRRIDRMRNVLAAAGMAQDQGALPPDQVESLFSKRVQPLVVELSTGQETDAVDPLEYDQRAAAQDPQQSRMPREDPARVRRVPKLGAVYLVSNEHAEVEALVIPVHGAGLWGQMYGYLALAADTRTIRGVSFYQHQETPGLGAQIENERYIAGWIGRQVADEAFQVRFEVTKDAVGDVASDPYRVDAITGATQTSNGLTALFRFWVGDEGYGKYLEGFRKNDGARGAS